MYKEMKKHIDNHFLKENINKDSKTSTRLVQVDYSGKKRIIKHQQD